METLDELSSLAVSGLVMQNVKSPLIGNELVSRGKLLPPAMKGAQMAVCARPTPQDTVISQF